MGTDNNIEQIKIRDSEIQVSRRWIVRHCGNAHPHICSYLKTRHGFLDLCRMARDPGSKSKGAHFKDLIGDFLYVLKNIRHVRTAQEIIAIGPMAVNMALLSRLGLLPRCKRIYWFGLFIHSPRWLSFSRPFINILDSEKIRYVLFSNFEKSLYRDSLLLSEDRMVYVPYGDLSVRNISEESKDDAPVRTEGDEFFFSGGYSNRDYLSLIEIFKTLPFRLVIICASMNTEIDESILPPNIKVFRDEPSDSFESYVKAAKACIIPIAHNTGAAGQSCLLRYMKNRKVIIASDTGIIREYITDAVSGILVKNNRDAMAAAIRAVATNIEVYQKYADAAQDRFIKFFSGEAIERQLDELIGHVNV